VQNRQTIKKSQIFETFIFRFRKEFLNNEDVTTLFSIRLGTFIMLKK